uniref:Aminotransferase class V domain-containing protein n=1 Tax=Physcomitrium patens TaxID=3218 RepID=A0A7I4A4D1_PHYPA
MKRLNFDVDVIDCEGGEGVDLDILRQKLEADQAHVVKAVCVVHNETSTGVTSDIGEVRQVLGIDLLLPTRHHQIVTYQSIEASKHAKSTRGYFDWGEYIKCYKSGSYWPYTPSVQLLYGLRASLDLILKVEGLENVIARHSRLAEATRQAVIAWGLTVCAKEPKWHSTVVTGVVVPPWLNSNDVIKVAWKKYNLSLGIGLGKVAGKVFRIGHLGYVDELQLLGALAGVELALTDVGYPVTLGSGVAAAQAILSRQTPSIASRL